MAMAYAMPRAIALGVSFAVVGPHCSQAYAPTRKGMAALPRQDAQSTRPKSPRRRYCW